MIGVRLDGRLGNQLFQYALAMSLAKKFNTFYIIDNDFKADSVKKYFQTNSLLNNKISRAFFKKWIAPSFLFIHQKGNETTDDMIPLLKDSQFYKGFFQSELYFKNISSSIQKQLKIKKSYRNEFADKYGHLFQNEKVLAIHYRIGDYLNFGGVEYGGFDLSLPETYYKNALKKIQNLEGYKIILVTDDIENAAIRLPEIKEKLIISDSEVMDFQILMHADKLIISNSSFAWWAAYLNKKQAEVFAPENWLGFKINTEMPSNVVPEKFKTVSVY